MSLAAENEEFPVVCETCLGENPLIRMTKQSYARPCKICERPFTVYRWKPGPTARYKKTELCRTCAKLKNVCQTCVLDLQYGLPVQVRDSVLREEERVDLPQSAVGRAVMIEQYERKMEAGVTASSSSAGALFAPLDPSASAAATSALSTAYAKLTHKDATLSRLTRPAPYYKRNEAHLCTFFARGECNRGALCPYRHEMPPPPSALSQQNIKDRYAGRNDPVALKMLGRGRAGAVENGALVPPEDPSLTTLWVGGVGADGKSDADVEGEVAQLFGVYGPLKSVRVLAEKRCAFVSFVSRAAAEDAAAKAGGECGQKGWTLRWAKPKPRTDPTSDHGSAFSAGRGEASVLGGDGVASASASAYPAPFAATVALLTFPSLAPPPGMSLTSYPSQHPQQSAARFFVDT